MTLESFKAWKAAFDKETALRKAQEEEERLKNLTPKEREEWKRSTTRLSGEIVCMTSYLTQLYSQL